MIVYLAGPITETDGWTTAQNREAALVVFFDLVKAGINAVCPHLISYHKRAADIDYERWLQYDFAMIDVCTHVLMLPRWEMSPGACRERAYAEKIGKIVLYEMPELK